MSFTPCNMMFQLISGTGYQPPNKFEFDLQQTSVVKMVGLIQSASCQPKSLHLMSWRECKSATLFTLNLCL